MAPICACWMFGVAAIFEMPTAYRQARMQALALGACTKVVRNLSECAYGVVGACCPLKVAFFALSLANGVS
eukprot:6184966-Pleurochrysis_carterae.AAC.2